MFYTPSLIKYNMKNHFPILDYIEILLEETFRYMLGYYYYIRKSARLYFVVNKPRQIVGD